ncbi:MAG: hypothetical protein AABN95_15540 [Acidobacteriota bacterium]
MRKLARYEGIIEDGRAKLPPDGGLPGKTRVFVNVPNSEAISAPYVASPHLANPEQLKDFEKRISKSFRGQEQQATSER